MSVTCSTLAMKNMILCSADRNKKLVQCLVFQLMIVRRLARLADEQRWRTPNDRYEKADISTAPSN